MGAVWARTRAELRSGRRRWLGLALLVAVIGGSVMAAAAGARRTDGAYSRFLDVQRAGDVAVLNYPGDGTAVFDFAELAELPMVDAAAYGPFEWFDLGAGVGGVASVDGRLGRDVNRFKFLEGRPLDPERPEEVVVAFDLAEREGLRVGSRFSFLSDEVAAASLEEAPPEERAEIVDAIQRIRAGLPGGMLEVVGIEASPGEFPPQFGGNNALLHVSPALAELTGMGENQYFVARLRRGAADVAAFNRELRQRSDGKLFAVLDQGDHAAAVQRSLNLQARALWILAALVALAGGLILTQTVARSTFLESQDHPNLAALGMDGRQLTATQLLRWASVAGAGAVGALMVAAALSPVFPTGLARVAEPDPGPRLDVPVLAAGGTAMVLGMLVLAAVSTWRITGRRMGGPEGPHAMERPSRLAGAAAGAGLPPSLVAGLRMGLERGRGRTSVPVASSVAGITVGVASLVAALTFGASLSHLLRTPELYGLRWDAEIPDFENAFSEEAARRVGALPGVAGVGVGESEFPVRIDGVRAEAVAFDEVVGNLGPPVLEGRRPVGRAEIALGSRTLAELGGGLGQRVDVSSADQGGVAVPMRVVGRIVLPALSSGTHLGEGALVGVAGLEALADEPQDGAASTLFLKFEPGADPERMVAEVAAALDRPQGFFEPFDRGEPTDIVNFGRVENMPLVLGAILALVAAATLAHTLASAIRRRRRDLAILKTLGFVRHQVMLAVVWQATVLAAAALLIGVPLGAAGGRWLWTTFARELGVVAEAQVPILPILVVILAAVVIADLIAALPARVAAQTRPALVLRTE